jgi:hypothetical protein
MNKQDRPVILIFLLGETKTTMSARHIKRRVSGRGSRFRRICGHDRRGNGEEGTVLCEEGKEGKTMGGG